jgi:hypothetical protein
MAPGRLTSGDTLPVIPWATRCMQVPDRVASDGYPLRLLLEPRGRVGSPVLEARVHTDQPVWANARGLARVPGMAFALSPSGMRAWTPTASGERRTYGGFKL